MEELKADFETMNHRQLIDELFKHCKQRASGTVFFNLQSGESARLVLNRGVIHWVAYEQLRGREAIESMRRIAHARFSFNPHLRMAIGEQKLPSTTFILKRLYKQSKKSSKVVDLPIERKTRRPPVNQNNLTDETYFSLDQVRVTLEKEAMEYLGPMAKVLCADYLKSMPSQLNASQLRKVIVAIKLDINDDRKEAHFVAKVEKALMIK
jgi:hypothetical protein